MKKRVLSALMVLCMVLTLLPVSAFAAPKPVPGTGELQPGQVEAWKTAEYNEETGNVDITLHVRGKNVETTTTTTNTLNVVLVVDNSGSMDEGQGKCTSTSYTKHTDWAWFFGWYEYDYWTCDTCGKTYYNDPGNHICTGKISKMSAAQNAATVLVNALAQANPNNQVAIASFESDIVDNASIGLTKLDSQENREKLISTIANMRANGGTSYTAGLQLAQGYLKP